MSHVCTYGTLLFIIIILINSFRFDPRTPSCHISRVRAIFRTSIRFDPLLATLATLVTLTTLTTLDVEKKRLNQNSAAAAAAAAN
jgi:hypothetical protein